MTTDQIITIIYNSISIVCWIVAAICYGLQNRWVNKMEIILCGHIDDIHKMKRTINHLETRINELNIRLNELDNQTANNSPRGAAESNQGFKN